MTKDRRVNPKGIVGGRSSRKEGSRTRRSTPPKLVVNAAVMFAEEMWLKFEGEKKTIKLNTTWEDKKNVMLVALQDFYLETPKEYHSTTLFHALPPLIYSFYTVGWILAAEEMVKGGHRTLDKTKAELEATRNWVRKSFGLKYPDSILRGIRGESESGRKIVETCKQIAKQNGWDPEDLRQAYYRRYPKK